MGLSSGPLTTRSRRPTDMRKVREVLRLRHELDVSAREIALSVGVARSSVAE